MPWRQVDAMTTRRQFIVDARQRSVTFTDLCALYGISRVTGYKWLDRANASGLDPRRSSRGVPTRVGACMPQFRCCSQRS